MLRTVLRRAGACALALAALLTSLSVVAATPAAAATPQVPRYSCPGAEIVGGTARGASSAVGDLLKANPARCGQRLQALANYGVHRYTWEPSRKVPLGDGRFAFEYVQYFESKNNDGTWTQRVRQGTVRVLIGLRCLSGRTVNKPFVERDSMNNPPPPLFTVQYTSLNFCYNGSTVYFRDTPQFRLYIGARYQLGLGGACAGVSRTDNNVARSDIFITCNAVFTNKSVASYRAEAKGDLNGSSRFSLPPLLNFGVPVGEIGFVGFPLPADQIRYYTIRITADGCYTVSGVGNNSRTCF